jgi:hypothetical protein
MYTGLRNMLRLMQELERTENASEAACGNIVK